MENQEMEMNDFYKNYKKTESKLQSYTAPKDAFEDDLGLNNAGEDELLKATNKRRIANREDDYKKKRYRPLSPERFDPLKDFDKLPDSKARTYGDIMLEQNLENERKDLLKQQSQKKKEQINIINNIENSNITVNSLSNNDKVRNSKLENDQISSTSGSSHATKVSKTSEWDKLEKQNKWETPGVVQGRTLEGMTTPRRKRWDLTPVGENIQTPKSEF